MSSDRSIVEIVKEHQESLKDLAPYCIGIICKEEADVLDCAEGDEYAIFHAEQRKILCDWFSGNLDLGAIATRLLELEEENRKLKDAIQKAVKVIEEPNDAIVDTIWVSDGMTLVDLLLSTPHP